MATVAIIHAAEDALPARALAEKLRHAKLNVLLEKQPGEDQRNAAKEAKVTLALWSPRSTAQQALIDDAAFAKGKSKLLHICMQNADAPDAFRNDKIVNLTGWRGEDDFPAWRELAKLVTDRAGVAPIPPPPPKPPSGFFQPGLVREAQPAAAGAGQGRAPAPRQSAPPPRPQAPPPQRPAAPRPQPAARHAPEPAQEKGGGRMVMVAIATFLVVGLAGGSGYWFWSQSQNADAVASAWEAVDREDPAALRAFIAGDPGERRNDAQQALAALEERRFAAARETDTIEGFEAFLNDFPSSQHALVARGRIAELQARQPAPAPAPLEPPAAALDPDLVPPGATAPPATQQGPATLTPPSEPDDPAPPDDAP